MHLARVGGASYRVRSPALRQRDSVPAPTVERVICARPLPIVTRAERSSDFVVVGAVEPRSIVTLDVASTPSIELRKLHLRGAVDELEPRIGARPLDVAAAGYAASP